MRLAVLSHACLRAVNRKVYKAMAGRGVEVTIIAPTSIRGGPPDPQEAGSPKVHFLPLSSENPRTYHFEGAEAVLQAFKPDAVLVDADPLSLMTVRMARWCRANGARLLCMTVENLDFGVVPHLKRTGLATLPQVIAKNILNLMTRRAVDEVFTISDEGTRLFRAKGFRSVTQIPLGFDPGIFHSDPDARRRIRDAHGIAPDAPVLGYFGRVTPQKGVHLIIEALARIHAKAPEARWHILIDRFQSDGAYVADLKRRIAAGGLTSRIVEFDADHQQIAAYMAAADAVVLASLTLPASLEQYGRVIPEAMACGALAIVSDSGTPKQLVAGNGIVFPEGDVARLTQILSDVIASPETYRDLAETGRRHALANLSISRQAELMLQALPAALPETKEGL